MFSMIAMFVSFCFVQDTCGLAYGERKSGGISDAGHSILEQQRPRGIAPGARGKCVIDARASDAGIAA
jgi:hypothetical protein